ncbi:TetR/AcrR family transcriptional regulator [Actinomadura sp. DC4]|uniref:TetR/AcrR family transcriptional regulator n=1 Tax=Actinomadura sp. DC4 TaxID=3055069 RepID=UPI0025AFCC6D|nr:TetR/AcrR family transcriptional regulator [Actinomadura sp. DC4]MDN3357424.1 TetR family transcriptional regulator [Actinomadura sp. DC4]
MTGLLEAQTAGLRERKKQRTRWALIDAALDLFLAQGYETTTIDEIVAAVDVSQRTYFRYFAGKEGVALSVLTEYDALFVGALAERPPEEPPVPAMRAALDVSLEAILDGDVAHVTRFRKLHGLLDRTPALAAGQLRRFAEVEQTAAALIARRVGTDLLSDPRPHLLVASFMAVVRVAYESCVRDAVVEPAAFVPRVRGLIALATDTLPAAWSAR